MWKIHTNVHIYKHWRLVDASTLSFRGTFIAYTPIYIYTHRNIHLSQVKFFNISFSSEGLLNSFKLWVRSNRWWYVTWVWIPDCRTSSLYNYIPILLSTGFWQWQLMCLLIEKMSCFVAGRQLFINYSIIKVWKWKTWKFFSPFILSFFLPCSYLDHQLQGFVKGGNFLYFR